MSKKDTYIIGIDEVGRGSLAGPVTIAAVAAMVNSKFKIQNSKLRLRDSKKLSPKQREIWFKYIKNHPRISYALASVSPRVVDRINISQAANLAAGRALRKLIVNRQLPTARIRVFLDGGLYVNKSKIKNQKSKLQIKNKNSIKTITRGDEKINAIKLASIVAKVTRDRRMTCLAKKYPQYGFEIHKGYGTKRHFEALKKFGFSEIHRRTFMSQRMGVVRTRTLTKTTRPLLFL